MGGEGEKRAEGKGEKERLSFSPNSLFPPLSGKRQPILGILYFPSSEGQLLTVISLAILTQHRFFFRRFHRT